MKGRLSSTIWLLVTANIVALIAVLAFAFAAGQKAGQLSILDAFSAPGHGPLAMLTAVGLVLVGSALLGGLLWSRVLKPVSQLADFSERLSNSDYKASADIDSDDDFGFIVQNLNKTAERVRQCLAA